MSTSQNTRVRVIVLTSVIALVGALFALPAGAAGTFVDDDGSIFESDIEWMAAEGITKGCNPPINDRFCPDDDVTRGQMAAFLDRTFDLPAATKDHFTDDNGSIFEDAINRIAEAGITKGCNPPGNTLFCPDDVVARGQMAAFLTRAHDLTDDGGGDLFTDDDSSIFESDIDRLGAAGITKGCNPPINDKFCPDDNVTRGQMAAFFHRAAPPPEQVQLQFLTVSDWHGQLDPLFVFGEGTFGGAAELAAYWDADRAANPNTITLTAGDAYGAAPPLSNFFDEEPSVRAMRMMGFDVDTFGNHNFDDGIAGLQNLIDIAKRLPAAEAGEPFQYVSANLDNRDDNLSGVEDFVILDRSGVKVAIIGITNPEAPTLVFPGNFGTIVPTDPVAAAMAARVAAESAGADIFVAITHLGVTGFDGGGKALGPVIDFANGVDGFDLILGDHTNVEFSGEINGALVVENRSKGRTYARISITTNRVGEVFAKSVVFVDPISADVTPDPEIVAFLDPLRAQLDAILSGVIGQSTVEILRSDECGQSSGRTCESLIGNVVTDAMRDRYGTDFAITNAGGLRADLTCPDPDVGGDFCPAPDGGDLEITDGTVLTVLPFGNSVVTLTVTGAELKAHLENGVSAIPGISGRFAQVSGLCFTYNIAGPDGSQTTSVTSAVFQAGDGTCTGGAVDLTAGASYTLAENDFMASGGDDYPNDIGSAVTRELLDQVVAEYIAANTVISPTIDGRITCTDSEGTDDCPVPVP